MPAPVTAPHPEPSETAPFVPRCIQRTGQACRDCVECLSTIPNDGTCAGCRNAAACKAMWGVSDPAAQHFCQWVPSRYVAALAAVESSRA